MGSKGIVVGRVGPYSRRGKIRIEVGAVAVHPYRDVFPRFGERVFVAQSAELIGDLVTGDDCSFWFHSTVRGDVHSVRIGSRTNVQDGCVLHVTHDRYPLEIGDGVVIGHHATVHGATVEDQVLIGIGARVLDGAVLERGSQVAAGAVVTPRTRIPAGQLALGIPARPVRALTDEEVAAIAANAEHYVRLKDEYLVALQSAPRGRHV